MTILNLHGYKGSANNSVYYVLVELGYNVISPQIDYDNILPKQLLSNLLQAYNDNNCSAVVGTSAGGFFAAQISVLKNCPTVFINPCLLPFIYLPRLGYNIIDGVIEFSEMFSEITKLNLELASTVVSEEDEIIDTHEYTKTLLNNSKYFSVPNGKHSGFTLPLKEIFEQNKDRFFIYE